MSWRHGTQYGYRVKRCRCGECRAWNARQGRIDRARRRSKRAGA